HILFFTFSIFSSHFQTFTVMIDSAEINHSVPEDLHNFAELRAKKKGRKFDVTITIGWQTLKAHMTVLSARIPLIRYVLNGATSSHIFIPDEIDFAIFNILVEYAYTGQLTITGANVEEVARGAALMRMGELLDACVDFMMSKLNENSVLPLLAFFRSIGYGKLDDLMHAYVDRHFVHVSNTPEFAKISVGELERLIGRNTLKIESEMDVFNAVAHWLDGDSSRLTQAPRLLKSVRVPLIPKPIIDDVIKKAEWVVADPECMDFIEDVKECVNNNTRISKRKRLDTTIFHSRHPSLNEN
ncbi:hypothetical protein PMAYCL1PPCAC_21369, partial [Pristionchus mayeri]